MTSIHQLSASRSQPNRCHHQYDDTRCAALDALSDAVDWAYGGVGLRRCLRLPMPPIDEETQKRLFAQTAAARGKEGGL